MLARGPGPRPRAALLPAALAASLAALGASFTAEPHSLAGSPADDATAPASLDARERDPAVLLVLTPKSGEPVVRAADVLPVLDGVLRARTDLALRSPEQAGVDLRELDGCDGALRLSCWTRALRPDAALADAALSDGTGARSASDPGPRAAADAASPHLSSDTSPRFLIVLAVHPAPPEGELVSAMLVDLDRATSALREARAADERTENRIFEEATTQRTGTTRAREPGALERFFARLAEEDWRPRLLEAGRWQPYGRVELDAEEAPLVVALDGHALGTTAAPRTTLEGVRPGDRAISVVRPAGAAGGPARSELRVHVERGQVARVAPVLVAEVKRTSADWVRPATIASGVALGAAGLALAGIAALAPSDGQVLWVCRSGDCATSTPAFRTPCDLGGQDRACLTERGLLLAPLGLALAATGATWAGGALLEDDDTVPWLPLVLGAALGALTYGLGAALDGSTAGGAR